MALSLACWAVSVMFREHMLLAGLVAWGRRGRRTEGTEAAATAPPWAVR